MKTVAAICRFRWITMTAGSFHATANILSARHHNAIYEPLTGLCVRGPCEGESLKPLKIEIIQDEIWLVH